MKNREFTPALLFLHFLLEQLEEEQGHQPPKNVLMLSGARERYE